MRLGEDMASGGAANDGAVATLLASDAMRLSSSRQPRSAVGRCVGNAPGASVGMDVRMLLHDVQLTQPRPKVWLRVRDQRLWLTVAICGDG